MGGNVSAQQTITSVFNANKTILPSSQYTPNERYQAMVWVCNNGENYSDDYYNHVIATPPTDAEGRAWYEQSYELTNGEYTWQEATSPFSSDETYKGQPSFQWVTGGIMADIYMRRTFKLESLPLGTVFLACGHDDAPAEFYINGVLVHSITDGWDNNEYYLLTDEQKALLKTDGTDNLIAVHVHQNWGGAFADCGLYEADLLLTTYFLTIKDTGTWPCKYYFLNYNDDISVAQTGGYASIDQDESDWMDGVGPFSSNDDTFNGTSWASRVRPLLIRRHFNLTAEQISQINAGTLKFLCSYDENPAIWLNGRKIQSYSGYNDNEYASFILSNPRKKLLVEGDNVIAVSVKQGEGSGHIDFGLRLEEPYSPTGITTVNNNSSRVSTSIYSIAGQYVGTSADNLPSGIYIQNGKKIIIK